MDEHGRALTCRSGRSVPISSQLRSHRLFSENWERLAYLVDAATLYHTGKHLSPFKHPTWSYKRSASPACTHVQGQGTRAARPHRSIAAYM